MSRYIIGSKNPPAWCAKLLDPYKKLDGSVGYLFKGTWKDFELNVGDVLIRENGRINYERRSDGKRARERMA